MRFPRRGRTSFLAVTAMVAAAALAGCGSGGGDGDKTVTVWASVDQPDHRRLPGEPRRRRPRRPASRSRWQKVENINQLIMTKIQANDTPDIALIPQPGVVKDIVKRGAAFPLDDVVDKAALRGHDPRHPRGRHRRRQALRPAHADERQEPRVLQQGGLGRGRLRGPAPRSTSCNALTDQIKADGGTPWCMGIEADTATGWPATDWFEDLVMRYGGAGRVQRLGQPQDPSSTPTWCEEAAAEFEELMFTDGNVLGGRKAISSTDFADARQPDVRQGRARSAGCSSRAASSRTSSSRVPASRSTRSACSASRPPRPAARTRSWVAATSRCC